MQILEATSNSQKLPANRQPKELVKLTKAKILIVDDEEDIVEVVSYNLDKEGYEIIKAFTGEEAKKPSARQQPTGQRRLYISPVASSGAAAMR